MADKRSSTGSYGRIAPAYEERIVPYYANTAKALVAFATPPKR